jgi:hypothetical protein
MARCRVRIVADAVEIDLEHPTHDGPCDLDDRAMRILTQATSAAVEQLDYADQTEEVTHVVAMGFTGEAMTTLHSDPRHDPDPFEDSP